MSPVPWVLDGEDPSEVKAALCTKLESEEAALAALETTLTSSESLTGGMVSLLRSFEGRLEKLEKTILPLYQETESLQRRQENIRATLTALDKVCDYYNVAKEVEAVVREGPGPGADELEHYLMTMAKLKRALEYFETSNPQSIELENVKALYEVGGDALYREFSEAVKKYSRAVPPVDLLNTLAGPDDDPDSTGSLKGHQPASTGSGSSDFVSLHHFPEEVQTALIQMAEWLNINDRDEFMNIYASVTKKSLDRLRDHHRSASGGSLTGRAGSTRLSPSMARKFSSPLAGVATTPGTPGLNDSMSTPSTGKKISRMSSSLNRRFSSISSRMEAATGLTMGRRSLGAPGVIAEEGTLSETETDAFCLMVSALQKLMTSEQTLMVGIIPSQYQRRIFELIIRDSLESVLSDGDSIVNRVKRAINSHDFLAVLSVFHVVRHLTDIKPLMDRTLEGCDASVRAKYNGMVAAFSAAGAMALDGFIDGIRLDSTTKEKMPRDGTVFQLTSNVLLFLEQLLHYAETVSSILTQDSSYNQKLLMIPRKISVSDRNHALVGLYITKILVQLNLTLVNKSDSYSDQFLKAVFRLNNNQYILKNLQKTRLLDVVSLAEPECEANYNDMILEQKRLYSQSWGRVLNYIWSPDDIPTAILQAPGKLADKYCRIIKDKFAGFNKEIEDISSTQRSYSIPDVGLRESLKRDNKEYILPKYSSFYDKYSNVPFTKHPEKYVKYTPAQVSALIDCFFDAAA